MNESAEPANGGETSDATTRQSTAHWGRLWLIAVCLMGVSAGGVYWWTFAEGEKWWHTILLPAKAAFRGTITLDGAPLRGGQLTTWPERAGVPKSVGFIGQDGEFILETDIDGNYFQYAFVGRHRVSIEQYAMQVGPSPPVMTSPAKYASPATSGLAITVDRDASKNIAHFELHSGLKDSNK